jgi:two-component system, OmpR family, sensor histidine kinase CreC
MKSIRTRILLLFTLLFGLGIAVFTRSITSEVKPRFRAVLEEGLAESAHFYAQILETKAKELKTTEVGSWVADSLPVPSTKQSAPAPISIYGKTLERLKLRVYVTDHKGVLVYSSWDSSQKGQDFSRWNDVLMTLRGQYGARTTRDNEADSESSVLYVAAPVYLDGLIKGTVSLGLPAKNSNRLIRVARYSLFSLAAIITAGIGIMAWLISIWISHPLTKLQRYVLSLSATSTPPVPTLRDDEIGRLANTIADMHAKLVVQDFKNSYLQTLVHELKSPVTAILGACELIEDHSLVSEKGKPFLQNVAVETRRIDGLLSNLLQLSDLENRASLIEPQSCTMHELVNDVIESKAILAAQADLKILTSIDPGIVWHGEPQLLRLAIQNLLQNAIDFSEIGGKIAVELTADKPFEIRIVDEGCGLPEWVEDKVFNEFFSLPRPRTGKKGTGFGLRLTRKIAELHGGSCCINGNRIVGATAVFGVDKTLKAD